MNNMFGIAIVVVEEVFEETFTFAVKHRKKNGDQITWFTGQYNPTYVKPKVGDLALINLKFVDINTDDDEQVYMEVYVSSYQKKAHVKERQYPKHAGELLVTGHSRVTRQPNYREFESGTSVLNVDFPVNGYNGKERTTIWMRGAIWGALADYLVDDHIKEKSTFAFTGMWNGVSSFLADSGKYYHNPQITIQDISVVGNEGTIEIKAEDEEDYDFGELDDIDLSDVEIDDVPF